MSEIVVHSKLHTTFIDLRTNQRHEWSGENTVTSGCLSFLRDFLASKIRTITPGQVLLSGAALPPSYIAVGSGFDNGAWVPGRFMTSIPGEYYRTAIAARDTSGQSVIFHAMLNQPDGNVSLRSASSTDGMPIGAYGIYAGDATNTPSNINKNGTLIAVARDPSPRLKNSTNTLSIDWTLTISGKL